MKKIQYIFILLLNLSVQAQVSEVWNYDVDTYVHNSSTYATKTHPVEIAKFSDDNLVIFSQNGTLAKLNEKGHVLWKKEIETCAQQSIIIDESDNIIVSCGSFLTKYDSDGEEVWKKDFSEIFKKRYLTISALTVYNNEIYIVGYFHHSKSMFQISVDVSGKLIWKKKYNQSVKYDFSFLPPEQIVIHNNRIYILAYHFSKSNSFIYSSKLNGNKRLEKQYHSKFKKIKVFEDLLFALGHKNNLKDELVFSQVNEKLDLINRKQFGLPRNLDYEKAIRSWSSPPPIKEEFEKKYITNYSVNDFEWINTNKLVIVGDSDGKPWILKLDLINGIIWNSNDLDVRYFKFKNKYSMHSYEIYNIEKIKDKYMIYGMSNEFNYQEVGFKVFINLFVRKIKLDE